MLLPKNADTDFTSASAFLYKKPNYLNVFGLSVLSSK